MFTKSKSDENDFPITYILPSVSSTKSKNTSVSSPSIASCHTIAPSLSYLTISASPKEPSSKIVVSPTAINPPSLDSITESNDSYPFSIYSSSQFVFITILLLFIFFVLLVSPFSSL